MARLSGHSAVSGNDIDLTGAAQQYVGQGGDGFGIGFGGNLDLLVRGNRVTGATGNGMSFGVVFNAGNSPSNTNVSVVHNWSSGNGGGGIRVYGTPPDTAPNLGSSVLAFNTTSDNGYGLGISSKASASAASL